jgi:hypothetical protein
MRLITSYTINKRTNKSIYSINIIFFQKHVIVNIFFYFNFKQEKYFVIILS